jgi:hypothetical protein
MISYLLHFKHHLRTIYSTVATHHQETLVMDGNMPTWQIGAIPPSDTG